jgi:nitrite reductase/ring-hydroxylating ferredoxin subunit
MVADMAPSLDRRQLLRGSLFAAGFGPLCCTSPEIPAACLSFESSRLAIDLTKTDLLKTAGSAAAVVSAERKLNLIVAHAGRNRFVALDRSCTHGGAQCTFNARRQTVQCTSLNHAEYDLQGTLLHGRTHGNLRAYAARREGSRLVITLAARS